jgi:formate-dependent nitrite reductase membrane component NrfD
VWLLVVSAAANGAERELHSALAAALLAGLAVSAVATAVEYGRRGTAHLQRATAAALRGEFARLFWVGGGAIGHAAPAVLAVIYFAASGSTGLLVPAAIMAIIGQLAHDDVWVRAGQSVPQS